MSVWEPLPDLSPRQIEQVCEIAVIVTERGKKIAPLREIILRAKRRSKITNKTPPTESIVRYLQSIGAVVEDRKINPRARRTRVFTMTPKAIAHAAHVARFRL